MKLLIFPVGLTATVALAVAASAQTSGQNSGQSPAQSSGQSDATTLFHADEFSLDLFGSLSVGQETINHISHERVEDDGRLGLGLGGNYFFHRNIGLSADAYTENAGHSFVDNTSGNLVVRFPIDSIHLAPYLFGGGGYQFDPSGLWFGQAGGGLDFRFTKKIGLFLDARYVFTDGTKNFGVGRFGVRFGF